MANVTIHLISISLISFFLIRYGASRPLYPFCFFFFFNDTATTEIYTLSLHDALPISVPRCAGRPGPAGGAGRWRAHRHAAQLQLDVGIEHAVREHAALGQERAVRVQRFRSEEHTSELQSLTNLVCRLLLEKKRLLVFR